MNSVKSRHRQSPKQNHVAEVLRREILDGKFKPNTRLPSQPEVARRFKVSAVTAHLAMTRLAREGFIYARKRHGTFVADKPPHLNNYALVFWNDPVSQSGVQWSRYYTALTNEAIGIQKKEGCRMLLFHGIDQHVDSDDRQRLMSYIDSQRLGGIIFANAPQPLVGTPILEQPGIPRVAIMSMHAFNIPAVAFDDITWQARAFDHLIAQGRKRIAILMVGTYGSTDQQISRLTAERGLTIPLFWRHTVGAYNLTEAGRIVQLLMQGPANERPNGLVICDDNIVEHSLAGLVAANVRVPDDVAVVTHCNFPYPPPSVLPVTRLGHHIGQALRTCLDLLDRQRSGENVPNLTMIPALFEEEAAQVIVNARVS